MTYPDYIKSYFLNYGIDLRKIYQESYHIESYQATPTQNATMIDVDWAGGGLGWGEYSAYPYLSGGTVNSTVNSTVYDETIDRRVQKREQPPTISFVT